MVIFLHSDPNIGKSKDIMLGRLARAECLRIIPSCQLGSSIRMYSTVSNDEMGGSIIAGTPKLLVYNGKSIYN